MQTVDVATRLAELYRKGEFATAHAELFAHDAISIEPEGASGEVVVGVSAIRKTGHACPNAVERWGGDWVARTVSRGFECGLCGRPSPAEWRLPGRGRTPDAWLSGLPGRLRQFAVVEWGPGAADPRGPGRRAA